MERRGGFFRGGWLPALLLFVLLLGAQRVTAQTRIVNPAATFFPATNYRCIQNEPIGNLIAAVNVSTTIQCRDHCRAITSCKFYSLEGGSLCMLFYMCERLEAVNNTNTSSIAWYLTEVSATFPLTANYACPDKYFIGNSSATTLAACKSLCVARTDCNFYTFFSFDLFCTLYDYCPDMKATGGVPTLTYAKKPNPTTCLAPPPMPAYTQFGVHFTYYPYNGAIGLYPNHSSAYFPYPPSTSLALARIENMIHFSPTQQACGPVGFCNEWLLSGNAPHGPVLDARLGPVFLSLATDSTYKSFGLSLSAVHLGQTMAGLYQGRILIPCTGIYSFALLGWDDATVLHLGDMNTPYLRYTQWSGHISALGIGANMTLSAGDMLPFRLIFANTGGTALGRLVWQPPGYVGYTKISENFMVPGIGPSINVFPTAILTSPNRTTPQQVCFNLTDPPGADVTLTISNPYPDIMAFDRCTIAFSPTNWSTPQCLNASRRTVDTVYPGVILFPVTSTSSDTSYNRLKAAIQGYTPSPPVAPTPPQPWKSCLATGDVHMATFDSKLYDYMEMGMHTIVRDCSGDFVVQTNLFHCFTSPTAGPVSCNQYTYVKIGSAIYVAAKEMANGKPRVALTLATSVGNPAVTVSKPANDTVEILFPEGKVWIKAYYWPVSTGVIYLNNKITLSSAWETRMYGLCGNYNGNGTDDFSSIATTKAQAQVPKGQELWRGDAAVAAIKPLSVQCALSPLSNSTISRPGGITPDLQCSDTHPSKYPFIRFDPPQAPAPQPADPPPLTPIYNATIFNVESQMPIVQAACGAGLDSTTCPGLANETIDGLIAQCSYDSFAFDPNGTLTPAELAATSELPNICEQQKCDACMWGQRCENSTCVNETDVCGGCANGGTCNTTSAQCVCVAPFTGTLCNYQPRSIYTISPCAISPSPCLSVAICSTTATNYTCACKNGYTGDGVTTCNDIDECASGTHACSGPCTNTVGSYTCGCNAGFILMPPYSCVDVDECVNNTCPTGSYCANTDGSFQCDCLPGYTKKSGNDTCEQSVLLPNQTTYSNGTNATLDTLAVTANGTGNLTSGTGNLTGVCPSLASLPASTPFTMRLLNIGPEGEASKYATASFNVKDTSDGGYCLKLRSPNSHAIFFYNCNHEKSRVEATYNPTTGKLDINGTVVRCVLGFHSSSCQKNVDLGNGVCTVSFSYNVQVVGGALRAVDSASPGGGTVECLGETVTYVAKFNGDLSLQVSSQPGPKKENGLGWLVFAADMRHSGDWLFRTSC